MLQTSLAKMKSWCRTKVRRLVQPSSHLTTPKASKWYLSATLAVALGLRLFQLERESFWYDELGQLVIARRSSLWHTILDAAQHTGNTPLDYAITHLMLYIGQSEGVLRLPAVVGGILSVASVYWLGKEMFGTRTALLSAVLLAMNPLHVHFSRELRFYSTATLLTLINTLMFWKAVRRDTISNWAIFGVSHLLALYAHYYVLLVTLSQGIFLTLETTRKRYSWSRLRSWLITASVSGSLFVPWIGWDWYFEQEYKRGFFHNPFTFDMPSLDIFLQSALFPVGKIHVWKPAGWWAFAIWGLIAIGAIMGVSRRAQIANSALLFLCILISLGLPAVILIDYAASYVFLPRQMLLYTPYVLILASASLVKSIDVIPGKIAVTIRARAATHALVIGATALSVITLVQPNLEVLRYQKEDWREAARYLLQHTGTSDRILAMSPERLEVYAPELSTQIEQLTDLETLIRAVNTYRRVWLVYPLYQPKRSDIENWATGHSAIDLSVDKKLKLYLTSLEVEKDVLARELVESGAYAPRLIVEMKYDDLLKHAKAAHSGRLAHVGSGIMAHHSSLSSREEVVFMTKAARLMSEWGDQAEAITMFRYALSIDPSSAETWVRLGLAFSREGDFDQASKAYLTAISLSPTDYWANHLLAEVLGHRGEWMEAISVEKRALDSAYRDELRVESLLRIADMYLQLGDRTEVCQMLETAYQFDGDLSSQVEAKLQALDCNRE